MQLGTTQEDKIRRLIASTEKVIAAAEHVVEWAQGSGDVPHCVGVLAGAVRVWLRDRDQYEEGG